MANTWVQYSIHNIINAKIVPKPLPVQKALQSYRHHVYERERGRQTESWKLALDKLPVDIGLYCPFTTKRLIISD